MRLIRAQADEMPNRDDLEEGLDLAEPLGLEHLARSRRDQTQAGDQEFARDDQHHAEGSVEHRRTIWRNGLTGIIPACHGQAVDGRQADEESEDENLVDQRIHEASEIGHGVQLAGDPAVKDVCQGREDE